MSRADGDKDRMLAIAREALDLKQYPRDEDGYPISTHEALDGIEDLVDGSTEKLYAHDADAFDARSQGEKEPEPHGDIRRGLMLIAAVAIAAIASIDIKREEAYPCAPKGS